MALYIQDNEKNQDRMEKVLKNGQMALIMKDIGDKEKCLEKEDLFIQTEIIMKVFNIYKDFSYLRLVFLRIILKWRNEWQRLIYSNKWRKINRILP